MKKTTNLFVPIFSFRVAFFDDLEFVLFGWFCDEDFEFPQNFVSHSSNRSSISSAMAKKDYKTYLSTKDKDRKENLLIICNYIANLQSFSIFQVLRSEIKRLETRLEVMTIKTDKIRSRPSFTSYKQYKRVLLGPGKVIVCFACASYLIALFRNLSKDECIKCTVSI